MSGVKIVIGTGAGAVTIDANMKFNLQTRVQDEESGTVNYVETFIEVEGDVVASTASGVCAAASTLEDLAHKATTTKVQIQNNSVDIFGSPYEVSDCLASPRITFFKTIDEDGNADSHWRYALTIYIKQGGGLGGSEQPSITDLQHSIQTVTENERVVRKIWKVSCKGSTVAKAKAFAETFKPTGKNIHGEIEKFFEDNRAAGGWIWDIRRTDTIIDYLEEPIQYTKGGADYVSSPQVGKPGAVAPAPILHKLAGDVTIATVRGHVLGYTQSLEAPKAHWTEKAGVVRWRAAEVQGVVAIADSVKGTWMLPYMEVWLFTGTPTAPDHSGHLDLPNATAPGD
jgi:hypothetical protein